MADDEPSKPLPFTKEPGVQADIRRALRELLDDAEKGDVRGMFVTTVYADEVVHMSMLGEKKYALLGAAFMTVVHQAMKIAKGEA